MVSLGSPSTPFRNPSRAASQTSPKGVMDFMDEDLRTPRLQARSRTMTSSSILTLDPLTLSQRPAPPIIRLKPRHDPNRSLWGVDQNPSQLPGYQATNTTPLLPAQQTDFVGSHFTSQRLLEMRAGEIPSSLLLPFDF